MRIFYLGLSGFLMLLVSACAPKQQEMKRFFWPPLTEKPKIEYIDFYQSDYDVKNKNISAFEEYVLGREVPEAIFSQPYDVFSSGDGRFFVSETTLGQVKVVDTLAGKVSALQDPEGKKSLFGLPLGITGGEDGKLYVVDSGGKIFVFSRELELEKEWQGDYLVRPVNIAVDSRRGRVYVADPGQHRVVILDIRDGGLLGYIGERGTGDSQFNFPIDLDLDKDGNLYVLDSMNARIKVFNPTGEFVRSFGERGTALGSFQLPKGLSLDPFGHVYVSDSLANKFVVFGLDGTYLMTVGGKFKADKGVVSPGGFYLPQGIDVDRSGGIWIVDTLNRMVHRFQYLTDDYLQEHPILPGQAFVPEDLKKDMN